MNLSVRLIVIVTIRRSQQQQRHCIESNDDRTTTIGGLHERTPDFANVAGLVAGCRPWWTHHACAEAHRLPVRPAGRPETALTFGVQVNGLDVRQQNSTPLALAVTLDNLRYCETSHISQLPSFTHMYRTILLLRFGDILTYFGRPNCNHRGTPSRRPLHLIRLSFPCHTH